MYSTKDPKDDGSDKSPTPTGPLFSAIDPKHDAEVAQKPIKSPPASEVSSTSTLSIGFEQKNSKAGTNLGSSFKSELV